jgi:hypothetical protein
VVLVVEPASAGPATMWQARHTRSLRTATFRALFWKGFARTRFPSRESFWLENVVPLTYRGVVRENIRFRGDDEPRRAEFGHEDVAIAQLHYTLLLHLGRV